MALSNITGAAGGSTSGVAKTISLESGTANTLLYTVPSGREFEGYITSTYYANYGSLNNVPIQSPYPSSTSYQPIGLIKLAAGTTYKTASSGTQGIYGIEYDAQL